MDEDLWLRINEIHSRYIELDDSQEKLEYEHELGALIQEFLSIVPHNCKFHFMETTQVHKHSVLANPDFSPFKLANAWMAMSKYASNLLYQPWRKEFTIIKLYSGFYKHKIEPVLLGGQAILELMGYRETQPGQLELLEAIDADKVRVVALDALLAMVECQVLRIIHEDVCKELNNVTWKDIVEAREMYTGTPEMIAKKLISKFYQIRHCRSNSYGAACSNYPIPAPCNGYASSMPMHPTGYMPSTNINGYYCQHYGHNVPVNYTCNVPSGKLIDLDPPVYRTPDSYSRSPLTSSDEIQPSTSGMAKPREESWAYVLDTLDRPSTSSNNSKKYSTTSNGERYSGDHYNGNSNGDTISYGNRDVSHSHRDLSHSNRDISHSNRDISYGNRDISHSNRDVSHSSRDIGRIHEGLKSLRLEEMVPATAPLHVDDIDVGDSVKYRTKDERYHRDREYPREGKTLERHRRESEREREREFRRRERDMMEKVKDMRKSVSISPDMQYESEVDSRARVEEATGHQYAGLRVNLTPENINRKSSSKSSEASNGTSGSWICEFCTYSNKGKKEICEICSKSRNSAMEIKPLESGGRQCPKCTLVNEKEAIQCEACEESLDNSATYI
ncbi:hypothetical protein M8J76_004204 [Diaphorina citri]|nr:hypothetical protein M8J76_004204 [Diaphorina citri]